MGNRLTEPELERILETEVPKMRPMTDEELGQAYDELKAEGNIGEGLSREDFIARQSAIETEKVEAQAAGIEPVEVPAHLRERVLEKAREVGGAATGRAASSASE
jgi:hypothetical protein